MQKQCCACRTAPPPWLGSATAASRGSKSYPPIKKVSFLIFPEKCSIGTEEERTQLTTALQPWDPLETRTSSWHLRLLPALTACSRRSPVH